MTHLDEDVNQTHLAYARAGNLELGRASRIVGLQIKGGGGLELLPSLPWTLVKRGHCVLEAG